MEREATTRLAAVEEISVDAAVATVLSGPDGIFPIKDHRTALRAFFAGKKVFLLYSWVTLPGV